MRIHVAHDFSFTYVPPARAVILALRLMPMDHDGQTVTHWRIEPSLDGRLRASEDAFGNRVHTFTAEGPIESLTLAIAGTVETTDLAGVVRGAREPLPPAIFLRDTDLSRADETIAIFARKATRGEAEPLAQMHALMAELHGQIELRDPPTDAPRRKAADVFATHAGDATDTAHVMVAAARDLGFPARYVSGYLAGQTAAPHAWAEIHIEDLGWIAFDATRNVCPIESHVRLAVGLDVTDVSPVRLSRQGGGAETTDIRLEVRQAGQ
jgi:transglutaminase-like putative cysteine protease